VKLFWPSIAIVLLVPACGQAPARPIAPAEAPTAPSSASASSFVEPPSPPRTGAQSPVDHPTPVDAVVVGRHVDADHETLELRLPKGFLRDSSRIEVSLDEGTTRRSLVLADVSYGSQTEVSLVLRRAHEDEGKPILGKIHTPASGSAIGHRYRFRAPSSAGVRGDRKLVARWADLVARHLRSLGGAFGTFAAARVGEAFAPPVPR